MVATSRSKRLANVWVSRLMPPFVFATIGYASYVFIHRICIRYLITSQNRRSTSIALITIYSILLLLLSTSYARTYLTVLLYPGYIPCSPQFPPSSKPPSTSTSSTSSTSTTPITPINGETTNISLPSLPSETSLTEVLASGPTTAATSFQYRPPLSRPTTATAARPAPTQPQPRNMDMFLALEAFVCESDGFPRWCGVCNIWKPDRAHHCSEFGRCVWRMDHMCPWVGGVVGETSYRWFYQTLVYGALYTLYTLVVAGWALGSGAARGREDDTLRHLTALVALSGLFLFFSGGMVFTTTQFILRNTSTIDAIDAASKVYQIAIRDPNPPLHPPRTTPPHPRVWHGDRCYIIVSTKPGENPWRKQNWIENFRDAMGGGEWWMWFGLWGMGPPGGQDYDGEKATGREGFYKWGTVMERLRKEAGVDGGGRVGEEKQTAELSREEVGMGRVGGDSFLERS